MSREFAASMLIALLALSVGWVGFTASDDQYYYSAALKWLEPGWYLPDYFGRIRNSVSVPIAWSILLFGDREIAVILPSAAYYLATLALTFVAVSRVADRTVAFLACVVFATFPVVVTSATTASADIAELFWASVAFWSFFHAWRGEDLRVAALFGCGAAMALAFSGRETVIGLGLFVAGAILLGRRIGRMQIVWVAAGGLTVLGAEALYYTLAGGDPLLRLSLFLNGASSSNDRASVAAFSVDDSGAFRVHPLVDPLLLVLARHMFGLGYWAFFAVLFLFLARRRPAVSGASPAVCDLHRLALWAGVVWFLFVAVALFRIKLLGRYYIAPAWFFTVGSAAFICAHRVGALLPRRLWLAATCIVAINLGGMALENKNPRLAERELAAFAAAASRETVFTDPYTAVYAAEFLNWADVPPERVKGAPPVNGALYFVVPSRIAMPNRLTPESMLPALQIRPEWTVVRRIEGPAALPSPLVPAVRGAWFIPEWLRAKLAEPRGSVIVVRASASGATTGRPQ
ncbi:MAG: glycosyltransferase family 39 protein [Burkholderiaceae bacterium]|nr:glycosyltransferase family 39 protein [Burkholderiaceae bacterium]